MRKNKLLLLLALLLTAATGARADWTGGTYTATANENLGAITVNGDATLTINSDVTVTVTGGINVASGTLTVTGPGTLVVNGAKGNDGTSGWAGSNGGNGGVAISGNIIVQGGATVTATGGTGGTGGNGDLGAGNGGNGGVAFAGTLTYKSGTVTANGGSAGSGGYSDDQEAYASSGSAGKAFANDVDFTQTTGYSVTDGTSTIGSVLNQTKVVISGGTDPSATTYSVKMKDGTVDAKNWSIASGEKSAKGDAADGLTGLSEGDQVTIQYTGRLKVKGVKATSDAAAAKAPATVTTAPTATTGDIAAGSTTALVSGGAADGGTLMYAVTTENTKPTSTEGFSATVPTAEGRTAGTYYVWYYVKADDTHTDSEISATAVTVTVKAGTPEYYDKLTKINDSVMDQKQKLKGFGRGYESYNSSLTAAQAYALATYQAAIDGQAVYVIMSSQDSGYEIHYAVSTDASATEHTADLYNICTGSNRMYYVAQ